MSFIKGLEKHGKGKNVTISRDFVRTRTSVQIGSYAHKFFKKQVQSTLCLTSKIIPKDGTPIY
jgi:hypothetical protein